MSVAAATATAPASGAAPARRLPGWWPLAALIVLAAVLRLSTLDLQSFWYDEAYTPVHVLHASLASTMRAMVHSENSPPLWYLIDWVDYRLLGSGELALRLPSALAGIATVPVAWAIGRELGGRPAAIVTAALVAVNPLFVWYSQEARAYGLFVLTAALALLFFLGAQREPTPRRMAAFAAAGVLALLSHYFAVFLLVPMVLWLLGRAATRRTALIPAGTLTLAGLALLPLISAQGGHGTQWIGRWPLSQRLEAIPQYYLTGYSSAPLGHGVELLLALLLLAGVGLGAWRMLDSPAAGGAAASGERAAGKSIAVEGLAARQDRRVRLAMVLSIAAFGILAPIALAALGVDYLAPRNLVGAMIPVTAVTACALVWPGTGRVGAALAAALALAFLVLAIDVDLSPRLQRGNWRGVARLLRTGAHERAITTVELGGAPLEYYLPPLAKLPRGDAVTVSEIDETGYAPLRPSAGRPPAPGFRLLRRLDVDGLIVYRFVSPTPRRVSEAALRRHVITLARPEVLVPPGLLVSSGG